MRLGHSCGWTKVSKQGRQLERGRTVEISSQVDNGDCETRKYSFGVDPSHLNWNLQVPTWVVSQVDGSDNKDFY
jgi:hypothetical protein